MLTILKGLKTNEKWSSTFNFFGASICCLTTFVFTLHSVAYAEKSTVVISASQSSSERETADYYPDANKPADYYNLSIEDKNRVFCDSNLRNPTAARASVYYALSMYPRHFKDYCWAHGVTIRVVRDVNDTVRREGGKSHGTYLGVTSGVKITLGESYNGKELTDCGKTLFHEIGHAFSGAHSPAIDSSSEFKVAWAADLTDSLTKSRNGHAVEVVADTVARELFRRIGFNYHSYIDVRYPHSAPLVRRLMDQS